MFRLTLFLYFFTLTLATAQSAPSYKLKKTTLIYQDGKITRSFIPHFTVIYKSTNPKLNAKAAGIERVQYNVEVWESLDTLNVLKYIKRKDDQFGDGFDDKILDKDKKAVTPNLYAAGYHEIFVAKTASQKGNLITYTFAPSSIGRLTASVNLSGKHPTLTYEFSPSVKGYFSIGYTGAPTCKTTESEEIWQPLIWQEKRVPQIPYLTLAYRCPIPTSLFTRNGVTVGVVADTKEFPFEPLPTMSNSRFGVALLNNMNEIQPQIFAPVLGGVNSLMKVGDIFSFSARLYVNSVNCSMAFEKISREIYGFHDYRHNTVNSLNTTLDNMIDYGMSKYSLFIDSLKGCNYSTDAPGAVKNVSSLNPLQIALLTGRKDIYEKRAYPMIEYMLSRDKFLFSLDPNQRIQYPSRILTGPCAPISELASLYNITQQSNKYLIDLAEKEFNRNRIRNLDKVERGNHWRNALALYRATNNKIWLDKATQEADKYLGERVNTLQTDFSEKDAEFFFWTGFTPDWVSLFELYEVTKEQRFLDAAHKSIRQYAMFVWFAPNFPESRVTVNPNGLAPHYAYLKGKGYKQMKAEPENVDAWRLSEIGLTPESSGTSTGHRGIFMANFAPWMLRIGYLTNDKWLQDIARSAIIGRYSNFPGYHINTARTTIYEKKDYPYHKYDELSVNSFHFNHIWPHMNILTDYLITDAYVKSKGQIEFSSQLIEGFAYLQSKFYGQSKGRMYSYNDINLYMPQRLIKSSSNELNYISGYNKDYFLIAFTNQTQQKQISTIQLNDSIFPDINNSNLEVEIWKDNKFYEKKKLQRNNIDIEISSSGITLIAIKGLSSPKGFRSEFEQSSVAWTNSFKHDEQKGVVALLWSTCSQINSVFAYIDKDDANIKYATMYFSIDGGIWQSVVKHRFPFEFTLPIQPDTKKIVLRIDQILENGLTDIGNELELSK